MSAYPDGSPQSSRPRLAIWTPLPPLKNGIADYSVELMAWLSRGYDIEVFINDGYQPSDGVLRRHKIYRYTAFEARHQQRPFDVIIYQMGGSNAHHYMYEAIKKWPGIVVLHDLFLGYALYKYEEQRSRNYMKLFKQHLLAEGADVLRDFERLSRYRGAAFESAVEAFFHEHYILQWIVDASLAQIVHMEMARTILSEGYANAHPHFVHMGVQSPWINVSTRGNARQLRDRFGICPSTFVIGIFGRVSKTKCHHLGIQAAQQLLTEFPDTLLVIAGARGISDYADQLEALVDSLEIAEHVHFAGNLEESEFERLILCCDAIINLRYPNQMQMSATLIQGIAAAKPLIISDIPEWAMFPGSMCLRITHGPDEVTQLAGQLRRLMVNPDLRRTMGANALAYFNQQATVKHMGMQYEAVIGSVLQPGVLASKRATPLSKLPFNKLCERRDFENPDLRQTLRDVFSYQLPFASDFPDGTEYSRYWKIGMQIRSLQACGVVNPGAKILTLDTGADLTPFYLTNFVEQVFVGDRYLTSEASRRVDGIPLLYMLTDPQRLAPIPFRRERLVVQQVDSRALPYPDALFDGVVFSINASHWERLEDVASAAYEIGRVLKPGGILALSALLMLKHPGEANGWDQLRLFTAETLRHYLVEASGLDPLDDLALQLPFESAGLPPDEQALQSQSFDADPSEDRELVAVRAGFVYCRVHLTLRKTAHYPATSNQWAKPSQERLAAIEQSDRQAFESTAVPGGMLPTEKTSPRELRQLLRKWRDIQRKSTRRASVRNINRAVEGLINVILRIRNLGMAWQAQDSLNEALIRRQDELNQQLAELTERYLALELELKKRQDEAQSTKN